MVLGVTAASKEYPIYQINDNEQKIADLRSNLEAIIEIGNKKDTIESEEDTKKLDEIFNDVIEKNISNFEKFDQSLIEEVFFVAIKKGYKKSIESLVKHSLVNVNIKDKDGNTPLILAIDNHQKYQDNCIVKLLIENNALINEVDAKGFSPLMLSARYGFFKIVKYLVEKSACINYKNKDGLNALMEAYVHCYFCMFQLGKLKVKTINYLKENGANGRIGFYDYEGRFWRSFIDGEMSFIENLLNDKIIDVNFQDFLENSLLMLAVKGGHEHVIKFLLEKGADVNFTNKYGESSLDCAFERGDEKIVKLLLDNGAFFDFKTEKAKEALKWAVGMGHEKIVEFLLENEVDANFDSANDDESILIEACYRWRENSRIVELLIDKGIDIDIRDKDGISPLSIMICHFPGPENSEDKKMIEAWNSIVLKMLSKSLDIDATNPDLKKFILEGKRENIEPSLADEIITKTVENFPKPSTAKKLNALILFTLVDHNGAFRLVGKLQTIGSLIQNYNVTIKHPTSFKQINEILKEKKYNLLFFDAHSNGNLMTFIKNFSITKKNINRINFDNLPKDALIVSGGCLTGGEKDALGFNIARHANRTVVAPKETAYFKSITIDEQGTLKDAVFMHGEERTTNIIRPSFFTDYYNIDPFVSKKKEPLKISFHRIKRKYDFNGMGPSFFADYYNIDPYGEKKTRRFFKFSIKKSSKRFFTLIIPS